MSADLGPERPAPEQSPAEVMAWLAEAAAADALRAADAALDAARAARQVAWEQYLGAYRYARRVEGEAHAPAEPAYCTQDVGYGAECGDDATEQRDGFPLCDTHATRHDALARLAEQQEAGEDW